MMITTKERRERKAAPLSSWLSGLRESVLDCGGPPPLWIRFQKRQRAGALQDLTDTQRPLAFSALCRD